MFLLFCCLVMDVQIRNIKLTAFWCFPAHNLASFIVCVSQHKDKNNRSTKKQTKKPS